MTALKEALSRTPLPGWAAQQSLRALAADLLKRHGNDPKAALPGLISRAFAGADLARALIGDADIREIGLHYLQRLAAEIGGGHVAIGNHTFDAPAEQKHNGGGHCSHDTHRVGASSSRGAGGQSMAVDHIGHASPPRPPSAASLAAARAVRSAAADTVLDNYRVRDGRAIGDVLWKEVPSFIAANTREAAVFSAVQKMVAHAADTAKLRDLILPDEMTRIVNRAARGINAA